MSKKLLNTFTEMSWTSVITVVVGVVAFLGGGTYVSKGNAELRTDVAVHGTRITRVEDDIREIKGQNNKIIDILTQIADKQNIRVKSSFATSTPID